MSKFIDLTGKTFGTLVVKNLVGKNKYGTCMWNCSCSCGNNIIALTSALNHGSKTTCGAKTHKRIKNRVEFDDNFAYIYVSGRIEPAIIDKEDYDKIKIYHWNNEKRYKYTTATIQSNNMKQIIRLHRLILGVNDKSILVDHKNGNPLDNRKCNLRIATYQQNNYNRKKRENKCGYTGIKKVRNKYYARIQYNKKEISLGGYNSIEDAIKARKEAEIKYFGEYRRDYESNMYC